MEDGVTTFVEVGPGNVLSGLIRRIDKSVKAISVNDLASLEKARAEFPHQRRGRGSFVAQRPAAPGWSAG